MALKLFFRRFQEIAHPVTSTIESQWVGGTFALLVVSGSGILTALKATVVVVICGIPGVALLRAVIVSGSKGSDNWHKRLGIPLGLILAVVVQQIFVGLGGFRYGWLLPTVVSIPLLCRCRSSFCSSRSIFRSEASNLTLAVAAALLLLADHNWVFLLPGTCIGILALRPSVFTWTLAVVSAVIAWAKLPTYWYLVSDDRLFEEAYSRSIHLFGFWDWYGSVEVWVPYHWFSHAIAGLLQATVTSQSFVAVGAITVVVAAMTIAISVIQLSELVIGPGFHSRVAVLITPIMGVFFRGESNSADFSVALGIWAIALVSILYTLESRSWVVSGITSIALVGVILTKVSTGVVITAGLGYFVFLRTRQLHRKLRSSLLQLVPFLLAVIVLAVNFQIWSPPNSGDRGRISFAVGESIFAGRPIAVRTAAIAASFLVLLFLPIVLSRPVRRVSRNLVHLNALASAMLVVGFGIRSLTVWFNNETFLESALLCAAPIFAVLAIRITQEVPRFSPLLATGLLGLCIGTLTEEISTWNSNGLLLDVIGVLGGVLGIAVLFALLITLTWGHIKLFLISTPLAWAAVVTYGLGLYGATDAHRFVDQFETGSVWAETGFGESDRFFFGTSDEEQAAKFLVAHASSQDVIGTNKLCAVGDGCALSGQTSIAAWSQLRSYVEAERFTTGLTAKGINSDGTVSEHPDWITERLKLMILFGQDQSEKVQALVREAGIDWFWLDLSRNEGTVTNPELVATQTPTVVILKIHRN